MFKTFDIALQGNGISLQPFELLKKRHLCIFQMSIFAQLAKFQLNYVTLMKQKMKLICRNIKNVLLISN